MTTPTNTPTEYEEWLAQLLVGDEVEIRASSYGSYTVVAVVTRLTPKSLFLEETGLSHPYEFSVDRTTGRHRSARDNRGMIRPVTAATRDKVERRQLLDGLPNMQSLSLDQLRRISAIAHE